MALFSYIVHRTSYGLHNPLLRKSLALPLLVHRKFFTALWDHSLDWALSSGRGRHLLGGSGKEARSGSCIMKGLLLRPGLGSYQMLHQALRSLWNLQDLGISYHAALGSTLLSNQKVMTAFMLAGSSDVEPANTKQGKGQAICLFNQKTRVGIEYTR